jgi:cbb3-type cytochrome oxidase maturation protein
MSLVFVALIAVVFLWAVKSGQFEDMEGPAHRILMDEELPKPGIKNSPSDQAEDVSVR